MRLYAFVTLAALVFGATLDTALYSVGSAAAAPIRKRDQLWICLNCGYMSQDRDGVCDNCGGSCVPQGTDSDGDGIPDGQDPDYTPPRDGSRRR